MFVRVYCCNGVLFGMVKFVMLEMNVLFELYVVRVSIKVFVVVKFVMLIDFVMVVFCLICMSGDLM